MRRLTPFLLLALVSCSPSGIEADSTSTSGPSGATTTSTPAGWLELAPMEIARSEHPAVVLDGEIVVLGGLIEVGVGRTGVTPTVETYNPDADTWRQLPELPEPRHHGMAQPSASGSSSSVATRRLTTPRLRCGSWSRTPGPPGLS